MSATGDVQVAASRRHRGGGLHGGGRYQAVAMTGDPQTGDRYCRQRPAQIALFQQDETLLQRARQRFATGIQLFLQRAKLGTR